MTMSELATLDIKTLLARINQRLVMMRIWLSHDHGDEPYWWARNTTAPRLQQERQTWRAYANLIHVERATSRGRLHGTRFKNLDEQRAWLAHQESASLPCAVTLVSLRSTARTRGETVSHGE
jgi:hypothetical protein